MTPLKQTPAQLKRLEKNLSKQAKAKKPEKESAEVVVTVHISPDCKPETLRALAEMMRLLIKQMEEE